MISIRYPRTRKHKTPTKKWKLLCQLMVIWYATTITTSFVDGSTGAYFNDQDHVTGVITAGTWSIWDNSSLSFPDQQDRTVKACSPIDISTRIVNTGSAMQGTTEYEVFYEPGGKNPMKAGEKISSGMIQPIPEGGTDKIVFNTTKPGSYKFKALQRPGHGNKEDTRHELWSETITIKCDKETPKAPDKGGDESKPVPPEEIDKKEEQEVTETDTANDQIKENNKEESPPQEEEKQEPEQPAVPAEPEPEENAQPEVTGASVQNSEAPPSKEEEQVEPSPASPDKTSNQE
ncbi:amyloid fiber anchoring/assembly protein TapA [Rossellomorea sp. y25]|uniref:amyloid fiber anchoring/assembly protein TapA n=1 Tax=Rossellomorea sp. y25 TaxID=3118174 RepID=UPI0030E43121